MSCPVCCRSAQKTSLLTDDDGSVILHSVGSVSDPTACSTSNVGHQMSENFEKVAEETSALSLWLQWTLPQLTFALLVSFGI